MILLSRMQIFNRFFFHSRDKVFVSLFPLSRIVVLVNDKGDKLWKKYDYHLFLHNWDK